MQEDVPAVRASWGCLRCSMSLPPCCEQLLRVSKITTSQSYQEKFHLLLYLRAYFFLLSRMMMALRVLLTVCGPSFHKWHGAGGLP